jgi:hypothetical protein
MPAVLAGAHGRREQLDRKRATSAHYDIRIRVSKGDGDVRFWHKREVPTGSGNVCCLG